MKEPIVAGEVRKKRTVKKTARPLSAKPKQAAGLSPVLHTRVLPKKATPKFTMAELTHAVAARPATKGSTKRKKVAATEVPQPVVMLPLPQPQKKTLTRTSRIGVVVAVFGFCFATVFGSGLVQPYGQKAQLSASSSEIMPTAATGTLPTICGADTTLIESSCVTTKPKPTFIVLDDPSALQDQVTLRLTVEKAIRVKLSVYRKDTHTLIPLGLMTKVNDTNFEFAWATKSVPDDTYILHALIENQYGAYEAADTHVPVTVLNFPPSPNVASAASSSSTSTQSVTTASSTAASTVVIPVPTISVNTAESATEFRFAITAERATAIKLYARQQPDGPLLSLGYAYRDSGSLWRYRWLPSAAQAGKYNITATVRREDTTIAEVRTSVIKLSATQTLATTTASASSSVAVPAMVPDPVVTATVKPTEPVSGRAEFIVRVPGASSVLLYAQGTTTLLKTSLGKAVAIDAGVWSLSFDSNSIPDGDYTLLSAVTNRYGTYDSRLIRFTVMNRTEPVITAEQQVKIKALSAVSAESSSTMPARIVIEKPAATGTVISATKATDAAIALELPKLAAALRTGDAVKVAAIKANIESITRYTMRDTTSMDKITDLDTKISNHVSAVVARTEANVATINKLITERTGDKASQDSDQDGVSDFDEVNIYTSNPFVADTDNDGFFDGAEILNGYDPLSAKSQTLVAFESPKEAGVEQNDILAITSVTTALPLAATDTVAASDPVTVPVAVISGKAPANSFVTLYIFSTPIIITIKTDADGGWNYHFDKELENGAHEVYVGVTDNAGKIVAKSAPFAFIKTAEAYAGQKEVVDAVAAPVLQTEHNLLSRTTLYVIGGLTILLIGIVLLLIGGHVGSRRRSVENIVA